MGPSDVLPLTVIGSHRILLARLRLRCPSAHIPIRRSPVLTNPGVRPSRRELVLPLGFLKGTLQVPAVTRTGEIVGKGEAAESSGTGKEISERSVIRFSFAMGQRA
jgi:hypothetical protein